MAVFPEDMNKTDPQDPETSIRTMDEYIRYMVQRLEFNNSQVVKSVTASGISSTEVYILLQAINNDLSALKSTVNGQTARLNSIDHSIETINGSINTINGTLTTLDQRVTALEGNSNETT